MTKPAAPAPAGELLYGTKAIAAFLGVSPRQAMYLKEKGALPCWKEGGTVVARRSTVQRWIVEREAAGSRVLPGGHQQ